jgi:putative colanic acid biosynthesis UDP-glucose lipid carrier transferase
MSTNSQTAPEPAPLLAGGGRPRDGSVAWRLPIAYRAISATAVSIDLVLIFASAIGAETLYHALPNDLGGEFAHTMAAATFVAVLFIAAMRMQKLYSPNRLILMDDQARSVLSAWCGAFLILASGVFTWGVSHDLSRGDILLFWALGAATLLAHRAFWWVLLPRALESGALRGRTAVSLTCEDAIPQRFVENLTRHGYHIVAHFHIPADEPFANEVIDNAISISICPTSEVEEVVLLVDPERMSQLRLIAKRLRVLPLPVTFVPMGTLSQLFRRAHNDIGETVAIEVKRAALLPAEQVVKRVVDIVVSLVALAFLSPLMLGVAIAIKLDSEGPIFFRQTRHGFNGRPFKHLQISIDDCLGRWRRCPPSREAGRAGDPGWLLDTEVQYRRTSPIAERFLWRYVDRRTTSARVGS